MILTKCLAIVLLIQVAFLGLARYLDDPFSLHGIKCLTLAMSAVTIVFIVMSPNRVHELLKTAKRRLTRQRTY